VELNVLPTADANRRFVEVTLNPVITDFDGFVNFGTPILGTPATGIGQLFTNAGNVVISNNSILMPIFSVQRANTSVTVVDGGTMVIGGLIEERVQNVEDKTPVLGDIPLVGRLFQSKAKQNVSKAVIFLVNVRLLDPTGRPFNDR
jgi:general secretion pathway protein D